MTTTLKEGLIAVSVLIDSTLFDVGTYAGKVTLFSYNDTGYFQYVNISEGKYTILGTVTKDTIDFDCEKEGIIKSHDNCTFNDLPLYPDYINLKAAGFHFPEHSFRSMLSAAGLEFNNNNKYVILKQI